MNLNMILGAAAGAALMATVAVGYNAIENRSIVKQTEARAEAAAQARTLSAIMEVSDASDRARAMRKFCSSSGKLYDFSTGKCRE